MNTHLRLITAAALIILPSMALAQVDAHHPDTATGAAAAPMATPPAASVTIGQPDQSANTMQMMQMMGQMMPMMQQMMQMMKTTQGMPAGAAGMPMGAFGMSDATKAYMSAMSMMDAPMMEGAQASDPDVAFVKAMIPHHQGAIDMAKAVLQYGKDNKVKEWANQIIQAQEAEIAQMQAWLKEHGQ